jgi:tRNA nucleotidyltransferase (CCA-adding enzyme)
MKIYQVGGAVRDKLLGLPVKDRDWVVVGASVDEMLASGYVQVGKDFPVFLHPQTKEEYALARTERKNGKGYTGFVVHADTEVTLEEDLKRRDLTINAIAMAEDGTLIDPYGGQRDLEQRKLRHVSQAFTEDPLRVLRIARFAARFSNLNFSVAAETMALLKQMVKAGELSSLVPERVWQEFERSLCSTNPEEFFTVLRESCALTQLFPELDELSFNALKQACSQDADLNVRFAVIAAQLNATELPKFCETWRVPSQLKELASLAHTYFPLFSSLNYQSAHQLLDFLEQTDALRRPQRFTEFLETCTLLTAESKLAKPDADECRNYLENALKCLKNIDQRALLADKPTAAVIKNRLRSTRLQAIESTINAMSRHTN